MELLSENKIHGGVQRVFRHRASSCDCDMQFAVFLPAQALRANAAPLPTLFWLSGLTCTEQNFITKAGAQRKAAELGMILVAPDTSPRGDGVPDDAERAYDFGLGAGFYVDATQPPWAANYQMYSYISAELPELLVEALPIDAGRVGISGHSMGGHGALTIHLKNPQRFRSVSAFSPIVAPAQVPWGQKALGNYLGDDASGWQGYDACALVAEHPSTANILVDQGDADEFLQQQLRPELFAAACEAIGQTLQLRMQPGYDHSYYFIASFIEDHLQHHYQSLGQ